MRDNIVRLCPKCRQPVAPSDIEGYEWQCHDCDEDFYDFECYKAVPIHLYCDTTGLYTDAEMDWDNTCTMYFPESIVRAYLDTCDPDYVCGKYLAEWLPEHTADETIGLYAFALDHGFRAARLD